jgi:hypothetical protein
VQKKCGELQILQFSADLHPKKFPDEMDVQMEWLDEQMEWLDEQDRYTDGASSGVISGIPGCTGVSIILSVHRT